MPLKKSGGPIIGLDIGSSTIKACELECKGGKVTLRGIAIADTPSESVVNNEIVDPVALGKTIKALLQQSGIKGKKAVTSVAGQSSLVVRIIEVPKMSSKELEETMKWEIERHVPFAAEQVVMDYQPLMSPEEVPDGQNIEVLLAVAQENLVVRHVQAVQAAGLQPLAIDIEPLAASRSLLDLSNGSGPAGTVAVVDLGASSSDISIYREGRIAFTRSIQLAGNNLTKAISDVLGQPLAEAERLKREMAGIPVQPQQASDPTAMFGGDAFGLGAPDFGFGGGTELGGTFGMAAPDPGASTATDTHTDSMFDVAGGGFSEDAFTSPVQTAEPSDPTQGVSAPFGVPPGGEGALAGPVPAGNPFAPGAEEPIAAPPAPASPDNPFESGLFGTASAADPFAPAPDPFAAPDAFGPMGGGAMAIAPGQAPAAMSEEEYLRTQITDAIMPVLHELVTELRRSLDFYRNRANGLGAQQVVITGGTARLPGLVEFLSANLDAPVVVGNPLQYLIAGPKSDPGDLDALGPVFPVSIGLAVRELLTEPAAPRKKR